MSAVFTYPRSRPAAWRTAGLLLGAVLFLVLWQYWASFAAMEAIWARSGTFAHAYLVPVIVAWLIWRLRSEVLALQPQVQPWALLPMALCAVAWLLGDRAGVNALTQLAATGLLVSAVPAVLGWPVARALSFPLGFLFFMVPVGEFVMPTMMDWTADVTVFTLRLIGIPVYHEGLHFVIPSGNWSVVEACSGVRYLIASFMVGTLFAYLNYTRTWRRLLFVLVALVVPVVANWARAVMIVLLGHYSGNRLAVGVDHLIYGWVFFGVVIGIMFFIGSRWAEAPVPVLPQAASASRGQARAPWLPAWVVLALVVGVLVLPVSLSARWQSAEVKAPTLQLPRIAGFELDSGATPAHRPIYLGARAEVEGVYLRGGQAVTLHVAFYRQQTYGRKLVNSQNMLVASEDKSWRRTASGAGTVQVNGQALHLRTAELRRGGLGSAEAVVPLQVRQLYWVNGRWTTSDHLAVLLGVLGQLTGRGDDAAGITFYLAGDAAARQSLDAFVAASLPPLGEWLHTVSADR